MTWSNSLQTLCAPKASSRIFAAGRQLVKVKHERGLPYSIVRRNNTRRGTLVSDALMCGVVCKDTCAHFLPLLSNKERARLGNPPVLAKSSLSRTGSVPARLDYIHTLCERCRPQLAKSTSRTFFRALWFNTSSLTKRYPAAEKKRCNLNPRAPYDTERVGLEE